MKIQTTAHNVELTEKLSEYLEKRLGTLDKLISDKSATLAHVRVGKEGNHHKTGDIYFTEINLTVDGDSFYAKSEQESLYASIDIAKDELLHSLKGKKEKKETLWRKGNQKIKAMARRLKF